MRTGSLPENRTKRQRFRTEKGKARRPRGSNQEVCHLIKAPMSAQWHARSVPSSPEVNVWALGKAEASWASGCHGPRWQPSGCQRAAVLTTAVLAVYYWAVNVFLKIKLHILLPILMIIFTSPLLTLKGLQHIWKDNHPLLSASPRELRVFSAAPFLPLWRLSRRP